MTWKAAKENGLVHFWEEVNIDSNSMWNTICGKIFGKKDLPEIKSKGKYCDDCERRLSNRRIKRHSRLAP